MKKTFEALLRKNGVTKPRKEDSDARIAELERIVEEQDEALMELAALLAAEDEEEQHG